MHTYNTSNSYGQMNTTGNIQIDDKAFQKLEIVLGELNAEKQKNKALNEKLNLYKDSSIQLAKELKNKKEEIEKLKNQINNLKSNSSNSINLNYVNPGEKIMAVQFTSLDQRVNRAFPCKNTTIFCRIEEMLYAEYPEFKEVNTYFTVNARPVKRFKSMQENNIQNGDVILLGVYY